MKKGLAIFLLVYILTGCGRKHLPQASVEKRDTSATVIKYLDREIIKDSVVYLPADSSWLKALIECDSLGIARLFEIEEIKNGKRFFAPDVNLKSNNLLVKCRADSLGIYYLLKERYKDLFMNDKQVQKEVITKTVSVNYLTWWQQTQLWFARLSAAYLLIFIGVKFIQSKFKLPFKK